MNLHAVPIMEDLWIVRFSDYDGEPFFYIVRANDRDHIAELNALVDKLADYDAIYATSVQKINPDAILTPEDAITAIREDFQGTVEDLIADGELQA